MNPKSSILPQSVNLHFWRPCNMRCGFCFATYQDTASELPKGHLPKAELLGLIERLAEAGAEKLTFVGGEPTLCPWLGELVTRAKRVGLTTMLVSNGWRLRDPEYMCETLRDLDWLTLSVDSLDPSCNSRSGRADRGREVMHSGDLLAIGRHARALGMRLKLNTVVHALNRGEDMSCFVVAFGPARWKLFQALPIAGQNDARIAEFEIDRETFSAFVERHRWVEELGIEVVPEDNADMRGTYAMIDPRGCFYDSVDGSYRYSDPIHCVGVEQAWAQVRFSPEKFEARGGLYDFVGVSALSRRTKSG